MRTMPENEFEKKVQQRMEELKFTPSGEVWKEVEYRIRKEKKKRRFFFWLPLLFLVLGGGITAAIWLTHNNENRIAESKMETNKSQPNLPSVQKRTVEKKQSSRDIPEKIIIPEKNGESSSQKNPVYQKKSLVYENSSIEKNKQSSKKENIASVESIKKESGDVELDKTEITDKTNQTQQFNHQRDSIVTTEIGAEKNNEELQKQSAGIIKDSVVNTTIEKKHAIHLNKKSKKWQWGIMLEKGKSQIADRFKLFNNSSYADNLYASQNSASASPVYNPSSIRPSGSFALAIFVKHVISSRLDINAGLSYLYLSTKMRVGSRVDSAVSFSNSVSSYFTADNFYRASNSNLSYTNRYHFLSLSAELSWKIINSRKMPVYWNNGFSYDRLLSSNALHFDRSLPGYYKDSRLLTHNHFFLSTGFSIPVFKRFTINPFAEYSLTPVLRNSDSLRTHFSNYGIRINFLLKNKK
jgi:hypothetical protein